jgi:hypothetical protein
MDIAIVVKLTTNPRQSHKKVSICDRVFDKKYLGKIDKKRNHLQMKIIKHYDNFNITI